jgi:isocitrate lyase
MIHGPSNIARFAARRLVSQWASSTRQPRRAMAQNASDSFQLLSEQDKSVSAEDELFDSHVQAMTEWWASPRFRGIKRPYTAESVVARRGTLQQVYPSSLMARKLFELLEKRANAGLPVHTCRLPIQ